ncbi:MAG: ankyrin repeat domain-containing protein [Acidimicrobiales bacterium]
MDEIDWRDLDELKRRRPALVLELMTAGDGPGFVRAVEAGFDVNVASDVGGSTRTPLHHAAAAGDVAALRLLVEHGADLDAVDPGFDATPLGWAEFFAQYAAAEYLRSVAAR